MSGPTSQRFARQYEELLRNIALKRTAVQGTLDEYVRARQAVKPLKDRAALISQALTDSAFVLDASSELLTGREKNHLLRTIIEHIDPSEGGKSFTIIFRGFDEVTQLLVTVERDKTPLLQVIGAEVE